MERSANPGAYGRHLTIEHPARAVDHMRPVHEPHAAAGGAIQEPWQPHLNTEVLVPGVIGEHWLADLSSVDDLARPNRRSEVTLAMLHQPVKNGTSHVVEYACTHHEVCR